MSEKKRGAATLRSTAILVGAGEKKKGVAYRQDFHPFSSKERKKKKKGARLQSTADLAITISRRGKEGGSEVTVPKRCRGGGKGR